MVLMKTAQAFWRGDDVEEAEAGVGVFGSASLARRWGRSKRRLDAHTRSTDQRLLDLEREVFKGDDPG